MSRRAKWIILCILGVGAIALTLIYLVAAALRSIR